MRQKIESGDSVLDLTVTNPTLLPGYPHALLQETLASIPNFGYEPTPFGLLDAREAIRDFYAALGIPVESSQILLTASTSEAYAYLFKLLCDPGDEILVPVPSYPLFEYLARFENVRVVPYHLAYDGSWFLDFDHLQGRLSPRTRAIVTVNPNNPTGSFLKKPEQESLLALSSRTGIPVIADEVFMNYEFSSDPGRGKTIIGQNSVLSFSLNGLSKMAGMPQLKLAWIVVNGPAVEREAALQKLEILLDTYLSVNTPVQLCARSLLSLGEQIRRQISARTATNLQSAKEILGPSSIHLLHTEGGWSTILQFPRTRTEEDWLLSLLRDHDVLFQPGYFFDMPSEAYAVASLLTDPQVFRQALCRILDLL